VILPKLDTIDTLCDMNSFSKSGRRHFEAHVDDCLGGSFSGGGNEEGSGLLSMEVTMQER
jgi:hypothetical protein